jgi:hypothetical protein
MEAGKQSLYIFYSGMGGKQFFTAGSDELAMKFIKEQITPWQSYYTVVRTVLKVDATREYFIRESNLFNGIEIK